MVECITRSWGNSIGIIIPSDTVKDLNLTSGDIVDIELSKKGRNTLRELWDFGDNCKKISKKQFNEIRREIDGKL